MQNNTNHGGGSSIVKVSGDVPPAGVCFLKPSSLAKGTAGVKCRSNFCRSPRGPRAHRLHKGILLFNCSIRKRYEGGKMIFLFLRKLTKLCNNASHFGVKV